jgi:hypothetical protein
MPPIIQNDLVLSSSYIKHDLSPRRAVITLAFNDGASNISAQQWAQGIQDAVASAFMDYLDTNAVLEYTSAVKGDGSTAFTVGQSTTPVVRGLNPTNTVTPNTAVLVQKRTGTGGRTGRGRIFLPWMLNEGEVNEIGQINAAYVAGIQADLNATSLITAGNQVIANRVYDLPWDNPNRQLTAINIGPVVTSMPVQVMAATQRRRMPRS